MNGSLTWKANGVESEKIQRVFPPGKTKVEESFVILLIGHDSVDEMMQHLFLSHKPPLIPVPNDFT